MNKDHLHPDGRPYTQEEFINKIKTDDEFAKKWGELGPIYGKQWRSWNKFEGPINVIEQGTGYVIDSCKSIKDVDQIANLINELKTNPDSRRLMVSAWNVGELDQMVLPPCHYGFQMYTRELSQSERILIAENNTEIIPGFDSHFDTDEDVHKVLDTWNIPTKLTTITYKEQIIESYD